MIIKTDPEHVKALFEEYILHMQQYHDIDDVKSWRTQALKYLDLYKTENDRSIFIYSKNKIKVGFALVNTHFRFNNQGHAIAEFYISKPEQLLGSGRELAQEVFSKYPGQWEVCVTSQNTTAYAFWEKVISEYTSGEYSVMKNSTYDGHGFIFDCA